MPAVTTTLRKAEALFVIPEPSQRVRPEVAGPMTGSARSPESITTAQAIWIPDSPLPPTRSALRATADSNPPKLA